jgi:hypothetical protein
MESKLVVSLGAGGGPFFSPDGQWIGAWYPSRQLRKIAVTGGAPATLCTSESYAGGKLRRPQGPSCQNVEWEQDSNPNNPIRD